MAICRTLFAGVLIGAVLLRRRAVIGLLKWTLSYIESIKAKQKTDQGAQAEPDETDETPMSRRPE